MDVTRTPLRFTPGLLLTLLCALPVTASPTDASSLRAEQDAALSRLKAAATTSIETIAKSPVDWRTLEARLSDVYKPMTRVAEIAPHETLEGFQVCLQAFDAVGEIYRVGEAGLAANTGDNASGTTTSKDLMSASPDVRRLHTQVFLEQMRCDTRLLLKVAESWPIEGSTREDMNRMLGLQAQPFRAFMMAAMGGVMNQDTPTDERTALAAQIIPVVRETSAALSPEIRENVIKATQRILDETKLDDPSAMQSVIDAFRTEACALSCERTKGLLPDK